MAEMRASDEVNEGDRMGRNLGNGEERDVEGSSSPDLLSSHDSKVDKVKTGDQAEKKEVAAEVKKPSKLKMMWGKLDLDMGTLMMMFK